MLSFLIQYTKVRYYYGLLILDAGTRVFSDIYALALRHRDIY